MYKIYQTKIAPNARRVRVFLAEKGVTNVEFVTVNLMEGENLGDDFRLKNPFGRIPVLEFEDGTHIAESVAISRYFEEIVPEPPLFGTTPLEKAQIEMWNRRAEISFMIPGALAFRNITGVFKDREVCNPEYGAEMAKTATKVLKLFDQHLAKSPFLAGERLSVADCTMIAGLDFLMSVKVVLPENLLETHAGLKRWHDDMKSRPSYRA